MDHEAGLVDAVAGAGIEHQLAVEIDFHQAGGDDLLIGVAVGIDEEVAVLARYAARDVVVDQVVHAEQRDEAVAGRDIHAHGPFLRADFAFQRNCFWMRKVGHGGSLRAPELSHAGL